RDVMRTCWLCPLCVHFEFYSSHRPLHSFPTLRSSDLIYSNTLVFYYFWRRYNLHNRLFFFFFFFNHFWLSWVCVTAFNGSLYFLDRKSTRLNSSHVKKSYAVFCLKKKRSHSSVSTT